MSMNNQQNSKLDSGNDAPIKRHSNNNVAGGPGAQQQMQYVSDLSQQNQIRQGTYINQQPSPIANQQTAYSPGQLRMHPQQQHLSQSQNPQHQIKEPTKMLTTEVNFNVKCDGTRVGDRVAIVGNISALGEWDTNQALLLDTSAEDFPVWSINLILPRNLIIEYKYVIIQHATQLTKSYRQAEHRVDQKKNVSTPIPQYARPDYREGLSVIWENFGNGQNRRLNTVDKKEIILKEEMGNKRVFEEYLEEKSSPSQIFNDEANDSGIGLGIVGGAGANGNRSSPNLQPGQIPQQPPMPRMPQIGPNQRIPQAEQPLYSLVGMNDISNLNDKQREQQSPPQQPNPQKQELQTAKQLPKSKKAVPPSPMEDAPEATSPEFRQLKKTQSAEARDVVPALQNLAALGHGKPKDHRVRRLTSIQDLGDIEDRDHSTTSQKNQQSQERLLKQPRKRDLPKDNRSANSSTHSLPRHNNPGKQIDNNEIVRKTQKEEDIFSQAQIKATPIDATEPMILASFLLPYTVERQKDGRLSIQDCFHNPTFLYGTLENFIKTKKYNFKWIGLVTTLEDVSAQEKEDLALEFKEEKNAYPIFMTAEELGPYLLYYENILRPLFHNFNDLYDIRNDYLAYWKDYVAVNQKVASKIIEVKNEFSGKCKTIWIHNNHLLMVPFQVKKQFEQANIGFYFHSPFPSSAHFRIHKYRLEILKSLMHCDLIAFHLFMYAQNFFKTCSRLCGYELEFLKGGHFGINFHGKHVMIRVSHIGIERSFLEQLAKSRKFSQHQQKFKEAMKRILSPIGEPASLKNQDDAYDNLSEISRPLIMSSIDTYHPISGLKKKLLSYKLFLRKYPKFHGKVVLIQFVGSIVQAFDRAAEHQRNPSVVKNMRDEVIKIIEEIHEEFGRECLLFQESNPPLEKRIALWSQTDIILCSSLKDGLCIQVLEYVACRKLSNSFRESIMICSEFAGCNEAMRGVLKYNPFSLVGFVETMDRALCLTPQEKEDNMQLAYNYIKRNTISKWTEDFLKDLKFAHQPVQANFYLGINFGAKAGKKNINRLMQVRQDFRKLNIENCYTSLLKANKCVILIEIEALPHLKFSKHAIPSFEVIEQLHGLLIDNRNTVIIVGNQKKETLIEWFGGADGSGNQFWLAAESGQHYKPGKEPWQQLTQLDDLNWIDQVKKILKAYSDNIDGSFIEDRESCLLWNYKNAETEHGTTFIQDIYDLICKVLQNTNTEIIYGNGFLEIKPKGIKKETLVKLLLEKVSIHSKIDFLFYLGNDSSDEKVFEFLKSDKANHRYFHAECSKYICVLEKKPSEADFYIEDLDQVRPLLEKLQTATRKRKKIRSFADLTVLRGGASPLAGEKLSQQNKNASIANLGQYIHSSIGLHDKRLSLSGAAAAFIPKPQRPGGLQKSRGKGYGHLSASPHVIEEESDSQSNLPLSRLKDSKTKYPSVGDAQDAQRRQERQRNRQYIDNASNEVIPIVSTNKHDGGHSEQLIKEKHEGEDALLNPSANPRALDEDEPGQPRRDEQARPNHQPAKAPAEHDPAAHKDQDNQYDQNQMEGGQASSAGAWTPARWQEQNSEGEMSQNGSTPPARQEIGDLENQDGRILSSNDAGLLLGNGAQSGPKISDSEGFFDAPLNLGCRSANRQYEMAQSLANGMKNCSNFQPEALSSSKYPSQGPNFDNQMYNQEDYDIAARNLAYPFGNHHQSIDASSAQLPNSQIQMSGLAGPDQRSSDQQSNLFRSGPMNQPNLMTKHHSSMIAQKVKPQPLSAIGLIHQNQQYSALSGHEYINLQQAPQIGGQPQPLEKAIFGAADISPLHIKMGSLAGSLGTGTPEGASLGSSAQGTQQNMKGLPLKAGGQIEEKTTSKGGKANTQQVNQATLSAKDPDVDGALKQGTQARQQKMQPIPQPPSTLAEYPNLKDSQSEEHKSGQLSNLPNPQPPAASLSGPQKQASLKRDLAPVRNQQSRPPAQLLPQQISPGELEQHNSDTKKVKPAAYSQSKSKLEQYLRKERLDDDEDDMQFDGPDADIDSISPRPK